MVWSGLALAWILSGGVGVGEGPGLRRTCSQLTCRNGRCFVRRLLFKAKFLVSVPSVHCTRLRQHTE